MAEPNNGSSPVGILTIDHIDTPSKVLLDQPVTIKASHLNGGSPLDSLLTLFYDGDPENGGTLFDEELIPRIPAGGFFVDPVHYRAKTCGPHQIFVQSIPLGGKAEPAMATTVLHVTADLAAEVSSLQHAIKAAKLPRVIKWSLLAKVKAVKRSLYREKRFDTLRMKTKILRLRWIETRLRLAILKALKREIRFLSGKKISHQTASEWLSEVDLIIGCDA